MLVSQELVPRILSFFPLDKRWIITAAHCLIDISVNDLKILTGTNNLIAALFERKLLKPQQFIIHTLYDGDKYHDDIALILLTEDIEYSEKIQPIELDWHEIPANTNLVVFGWGRFSESLPISANLLQKLNVDTLSWEHCQLLYNTTEDFGVTSDDVDIGHLCTLAELDTAQCNGDSGGPLVYDNKLVGLVSWGLTCNGTYPEASTRISYYHEWIRRTMALNS